MWVLINTVPQFYSKIEIENPAVKDNKEHAYFLKMQSKDSFETGFCRQYPTHWC